MDPNSQSLEIDFVNSSLAAHILVLPHVEKNRLLAIQHSNNLGSSKKFFY